MIEKIFSPQFREYLKKKACGDINNVDVELAELVIAGIFSLTDCSLVWLVGENENFGEKEKKIQAWLKLMGLEDVPICFHKLPFADPYVNNSFDPNALNAKVQLIKQLQDRRRLIVITTWAALSIKIEDRSQWGKMVIRMKIGDSLDRNDFLEKLFQMGYVSKDFVNEKGDLSWRGSIVDVFLVNAENPVRIEFLGGEVKSIRYFDCQSQKSIQISESVSLPIGQYFLHYQTLNAYFSDSQNQMVRLLDLIGEHRLVSSDFGKLQHEFQTLMGNFEKIHDLSKGLTNEPRTVSEVFDFHPEKSDLLSLNEIYDGVTGESEIVKLKKSIMEFDQSDILSIGEKIKKKKYFCTVCSENRKVVENTFPFWGGVSHVDFHIPVSVENKANRTLFLTFKNFYYVDRELRIGDEAIQTDQLLKTIKMNDFVVHKKHGIGRYLGIKNLEFNGIASEFLQLEYQYREFLYVPVYELNVLNKYMAFEGYQPGLDKLGGKTWKSKQSRARKSILVFARELLELYALRKSMKGFPYPGDYDLENRLYQGFRFVETRDQKKAIREVLGDLEAEYPMDRLICGDVSFGKTEVAVRAAFRVILNGRQVVMLCPTTILAWQHFETLQDRFSNFPVKVALLTRMVPERIRKKIYRDLPDGKVDVVVGTHALLSRKLKFKNLGLVIVDEEQRFGVFQKEKLKKDREDIDVLSLSATPIPRTLSLILSGLQDLSVIQSPPIGRLAIKNYVGYFSREIIISAILNEAEREGLVYVVYNRIDKIFEFKEQLQTWLPEVSIAVIHAKMRPEVIENNLIDFIKKKYRILISTTIIENGIDIPDVNTLIVVNAEKFGLTQLYQLRGRIGRGSRQAYAFFLVQSMNISDKARSRLQAIREFADLGSGYKLAEFDLKLRGMGSLLGDRQHGHIEALGFDYYLEMLNQLIRELKGKEEEKWESRIKINFSYSIDSQYISDESERIRYYKKILEAAKADEIAELKKELVDRFGPSDESIDKIFFVALIRILASQYRFEEVEVFEDRVEIAVSGTQAGFNGSGRSFHEDSRFRPIGKDKYVLEVKNFKSSFDDLQNFFPHS